MKLQYELNKQIFQDLINIGTGLFSPLQGFMNSQDYYSVLDNMLLHNSISVWTIPISLDIPLDVFNKLEIDSELLLTYLNREVAYINIESLFVVDSQRDVIKIFGTSDYNHPGVKQEIDRFPYRIGGKITITDLSILDNNLNPKETKEFFQRKGWKTIAGFQTRNPIHKAHEHLQRVALDICDGLFINPLVGWKKIGDFSEEAVISSYKLMIDEYYTGLNVYFQTLKTAMRYAGPREAVFHALIRKNLGCTHFIIGRDHAGVGDFYGKYEAQELAHKLIDKYDLGIEILLLKEPFYCSKCSQIVSEKTCQHSKQYVTKISGTAIRSMLAKDQRPSPIFMRKEIADNIISLKEKKFII